MIELKHISKTYDDQTILTDVNAVINKGDVIAIIGPSGCGKSTLLNCINVLNRATSGQIIYEGVDIMDENCDLKQYRKKIGMVFQNFNLFDHMTVLENAVNPQITLLGRSRQEACDQAMKYLSLVGMADKIMKYPSMLSGGQKQRAAIARTLSMDPEVILMDEPTSALDPTMVGEVERVIKKLASQGRTMVVVTHEMNLAKSISNRVFYMDEKGIYEDGPTSQIFENPLREKTKQFINKIGRLNITIDSKYYDAIQAIGSIQEYGSRLGIDSRLVKKAQLLFEESCISVLLPESGNKPYINAEFEYDAQNKTLSFTVTHKGEKTFDKDDDSYSMKIINKLSEEVNFTEITCQ